MKKRRIRQIIKYGWKDAGEITSYLDVKKSRIAVFRDIWSCFRKYYVFSNQYKEKKFWALKENERCEIARKIGEVNKGKDNYVDVHYSDWRFLRKYTSIKWQNSPEKIKIRNAAYIKHYGLGAKLAVQYGVTIICEHYSVGKITCGEHVLLARDCDIDYTGDLTIKDGVAISEGVKILTHSHNVDYLSQGNLSHGAILTPLTIQERVSIGARALIMPGVEEIGRGAMISSEAVVRKKVPPYAIVMGNPSRIVGFRYTPDQILEFEENKYPVEERLSEDLLVENYKKYYLNRLQEIKQFLG